MNKKKFLKCPFHLLPLLRNSCHCFQYLLSLSLLLLPAFICQGSNPINKNHPDHQSNRHIKVDKIVILKSKRTLQLWYKNHLIKSYQIALDKNPTGPKQFEGDHRTPEGLYYINDKNPNSKYHLYEIIEIGTPVEIGP
jgi:murein L,D-transpeptidase YafK